MLHQGGDGCPSDSDVICILKGKNSLTGMRFSDIYEEPEIVTRISEVQDLARSKGIPLTVRFESYVKAQVAHRLLDSFRNSISNEADYIHF